MNLFARTVSRFRGRASGQRIGPIGVDFALESLHLVQLGTVSNGRPWTRARATFAFEGTRREVLTRPLQFRTVMKRALGADRFHGNTAVMAVPSDMFRTMSINYKCGPGKQQEAAAILDVMKDRVDGDLGRFVMDYLPVKNRTKNDERLALVAVCERQPIVELLELARKGGLHIQALEIGPIAISRLVSALTPGDDPGNVLVINSGRRASYLTLLSGSDLLFDQEVAFGETALVKQVADTLDMPETMAHDLVLSTGVSSSRHADAVTAAVDDTGLVSTMSEILKPQFVSLVEEIKRVCLYAAAETRGGAVRKVFLLGSIARWPGSDCLISTMTGVDVLKMPDPIAAFAPDAHPGETTTFAPELAVATGLALRGMDLNA